MSLTRFAGIRALVQEHIRTLVREGLTTTAIERQLRDQYGQLYRKEVFREDVRRARDYEARRQLVSEIGLTDHIPSDLFIPGGPSRPLKYAYYVRVEGTNSADAEPEVAYRWIMSSRQLSKSEVLNTAFQNEARGGSRQIYEIDVASIDVEAVYVQ